MAETMVAVDGGEVWAPDLVLATIITTLARVPW
jgi:hypothetical protein